jgi:hypothetical protein
LPGDCLGIAWELPGNCLGIVWASSGNRLGIHSATAPSVDRADDALGEQRDVETILGRHRIGPLLAFGEQIEQRRAEPRLLQRLGDGAIARAVAAAAAAVREDDQTDRIRRPRRSPLSVAPSTSNCTDRGFTIAAGVFTPASLFQASRCNARAAHAQARLEVTLPCQPFRSPTAHGVNPTSGRRSATAPGGNVWQSSHAM